MSRMMSKFAAPERTRFCRFVWANSVKNAAGQRDRFLHCVGTGRGLFGGEECISKTLAAAFRRVSRSMRRQFFPDCATARAICTGVLMGRQSRDGAASRTVLQSAPSERIRPINCSFSSILSGADGFLDFRDFIFIHTETRIPANRSIAGRPYSSNGLPKF